MATLPISTKRLNTFTHVSKHAVHNRRAGTNHSPQTNKQTAPRSKAG